MQFADLKLNLQECGPRFTLKLISLQHGTFDTKGGEFEWVHKVTFLPNFSVLSCLSLCGIIFNCFLLGGSFFPISFFLLFSRKWTQAGGGFSCNSAWRVGFLAYILLEIVFSGGEVWLFFHKML